MYLKGSDTMYPALIIGSIVIYIILKYIHKRRREAALKITIAEEFGKKHFRSSELEDIRMLIEAMDESCDVDAITWNDLDMDAIYKAVNNCNSYIGEQYLYKTMHQTNKTKEERESLLNLMTYFDTHPELRETIQFELEKIGRDSGNYFLPHFIQKIDEYSLHNIWMYRVLSGMLFLFLGLGALIHPYLWFIAGIIFLVNAVIYTLGKYRYEMNMNMFGCIIDIVQSAKHFSKMELPIDTKINARIQTDSKKLHAAIKGIGSLRSRNNAVLSGDIGAAIMDYFIGATLWDFHIFHKSIALLKENRESFMACYNYIGQLDAAISVLSYRKSLDIVCTPEFSTDNAIHITSLAHPLVENPVCNDVLLDNNLIVTGSNASGKSTYIKAIGVTLIMGQSLFTCTATSASIPSTDVMTSMAIKDDILLGDSYYLAEIKYLRRIIDHINSERLTFCIIDEILRGTNRDERVAATIAILKHLNQLNCVVIVATHDVQITEQVHEGYTNGHFSEHIQEDDIEFDYTFKPGVSRSTNAIRLLQFVGFPDTIVGEAYAISNQLSKGVS